MARAKRHDGGGPSPLLFALPVALLAAAGLASAVRTRRLRRNT